MSTLKKPPGFREIEFKATKVEPRQFNRAAEILYSMAQAKEVTNQAVLLQEDYYLDHPVFKDTSYAPYSKGEQSKSLRIRKEQNLTSSNTNQDICLKITPNRQAESVHERYEYELKIENSENALEIFKLLGFAVEKIIKKKRRSFLYQEYEIVLDEIVGLKRTSSEEFEQEFSGYNIEIELKEDTHQISNIPACLGIMKAFLEQKLLVTDYQQDQTGIEKYM